MSGTHAGALKSVQKLKKVYGKDYFKCLGRIGGSLSHTGGFYGKEDLARRMGALGGKRSKRSRPVRWKLDAMQEFIISRYDDGCTITELARQFGVSRYTMAQWIKRQED